MFGFHWRPVCRNKHWARWVVMGWFWTRKPTVWQIQPIRCHDMGILCCTWTWPAPHHRIHYYFLYCMSTGAFKKTIRQYSKENLKQNWTLQNNNDPNHAGNSSKDCLKTNNWNILGSLSPIAGCYWDAAVCQQPKKRSGAKCSQTGRLLQDVIPSGRGKTS